MRLISKNKYLYLFLLVLILYTGFFIFFRSRPKLNSIFIKESNNKLLNYKIKNNINIVNPSSNKVNLGKTFLIKDNENWYQIIQLSFWRKEYLNLKFLNKQLKINDIKLKTINSNNYVSGTFQGEKIVYSCMKNSNEFFYRIPIKVADSFDINYWKNIYIHNLNLIFYSFKPKNYECYVVITTNTNFFKHSDFEINKKIFDKFIYE